MCRFSDENRVDGHEVLAISKDDALSGRSLSSGKLQEVMRSAIDRKEKSPSPGFPIFFSYESVRDIFGITLHNESHWPHFLLQVPDEIYTAPFKRDAYEASVSTCKVDLADRERNRLRSSIEEVRDRIREGELLQAVVSKEFPISNNMDRFHLIKHLLMHDRSRYVYFYHLNDHTVLGSSPENVFSQFYRSISVSPIAGTRPRSFDSAVETGVIQGLLCDTKELCEHRMLVDLARNDLSRVSVPGSTKVIKDARAEKFASVIHLVSEVQSTARAGISPLDVFRSVFPAGTVSGAPKRKAVEIIDQEESAPRGGYSGGIGFMNAMQADLALAIRTVFSTGDGTYTQAGAGIVKDSVPDHEVEEIISKAQTVFAGVRA